MASLRKIKKLKSKNLDYGMLKNKITRCKRIAFYTSSYRKFLKQQIQIE